MIGRNALCHCGSGEKYKKCHLAEDEAKRKPHTGEPAVIVCMPSRGQMCYETHLALQQHLSDVKACVLTVGRKSVVEARNSLAAEAIRVAENNPFDFTPSEFFVLWIDDDAVWQKNTIIKFVSCMRDYKQYDLLAGNFGKRLPYSYPCAWRIAQDDNSFPQEGIDCFGGDVVEIQEVGMHFTMMRLSLLKRMGDKPFDLIPGIVGEDTAFCKRARDVGARLAVGISLKVLHVDPADGAAYLPGMPTMQMNELAVVGSKLEHKTLDGQIKVGEAREYGVRLLPESVSA